VAKIILLLQFSWSPVWWPYIQSVCWCCHCTGPVCTQWHSSVETCRSSIVICHFIVHWLVIAQNKKKIKFTIYVGKVVGSDWFSVSVMPASRVDAVW